MRHVACRRAVTALFIVASLVLAVPIADATLKPADLEADALKTRVGFGADMLTSEMTLDEMLAQLEEVVDCTADVPGWFEEEVGVLPGARDVRVNGNVVGYVVDSDEEAALASMTAYLTARGWKSVPLGGVSGATFLKKSGSCTWALATCAQVGTATSVVIRCNRQ